MTLSISGSLDQGLGGPALIQHVPAEYRNSETLHIFQCHDTYSWICKSSIEISFPIGIWMIIHFLHNRRLGD